MLSTFVILVDIAMLAPTTFHWNSVDDPSLRYYKEYDTLEEWPRLRWNEETWEQAIFPLMVKDVVSFFLICKEKFKPPLDDPTDKKYIQRFVLMDCSYVSRARTFVISLGYQVPLSAKEIHDCIQWPRAVCNEGKSRVYDGPLVWNDILGHAAVKIGTWSKFSANKKIEDNIRWYLRKHGSNVSHGSYNEKYYDHYKEPAASDFVLEEKQTEESKFSLITIDEWMKIKWNNAYSGNLVACEVVLFLEFKLTLGKATDSALVDNDMNSPKNCSIKLHACENIGPLFQINEIERVMKNNVETGARNAIIFVLKQQNQQIVR